MLNLFFFRFVIASAFFFVISSFVTLVQLLSVWRTAFFVFYYICVSLTDNIKSTPDGLQHKDGKNQMWRIQLFRAARYDWWAIISCDVIMIRKVLVWCGGRGQVIQGEMVPILFNFGWQRMWKLFLGKGNKNETRTHIVLKAL